MVHHVLITRPMDQAIHFADEVRALGAEPVLSPLLQIEIISPNIDFLQAPQAHIVTSVHGLPVNIHAAWKKLPLFVVGEALAQQAKNSGFGNVIGLAGNAKELAAQIAASPFLDFIYWRGEDVTFDFASHLSTKNIAEVIVYRAVPAASFSAQAMQYLDLAQIGTVTLFSARTARIFCDLSESIELTGSIPQINLLCLSPAVLESVKYLNWRSVHVANMPTQTSMLDSLKQILQDDAYDH